MTQAILPNYGTGAVMFACLAALLCCVLTPVTGLAAPDELRATLNEEDYRLIYTARAKYSGCLQEQAMAHVDDYEDVRVIAGHAVEKCTGILDRLENKLDENRIDPGYYSGVLRHMKSGAIRRLLPGIMMYKAESGGGTPPHSASDE